jgi:hypothetical protein
MPLAALIRALPLAAGRTLVLHSIKFFSAGVAMRLLRICFAAHLIWQSTLLFLYGFIDNHLRAYLTACLYAFVTDKHTWTGYEIADLIILLPAK